MSMSLFVLYLLFYEFIRVLVFYIVNVYYFREGVLIVILLGEGYYFKRG